MASGAIAARPPPHKALLLAAGFGTRIRPLSYDTPKPMMPLWGKPLIGHAIDLVKSWGVGEILVNAHHAPESLLHYCRTAGSKACRIQLSFEPEILGTGGALKRADWFIRGAPFWMLNTDIAADLDPAPLLKAFYAKRTLAALWMHPTLGPRTVAMQADRILDFASPTPGAAGTCTFCGLQLLSPEILTHLPDSDVSSIIDGYRHATASGKRVVGISLPNSFWADLGSRERYLNAHRDVLQARRQRKPGKRLLPEKQRLAMRRRIPPATSVTGFAAVGDGVSLGGGASLEDCVLWEGSTLRAGTRVSLAVVGGNTTVRGDVHGATAVRCGVLPDDPILTRVLKTLNAPLDQAVVITLPARGSDRSFERIQVPGASAILIRYDDRARPENARYADHARFLRRHGLGVPGVLLDLPAHSATLFEDVGSTSLDAIVPTLSTRRCTALYKRVLDQLILLHGISTRALTKMTLEPPFSPALFAWERDLFATHFLRAYLKLPEAQIRQIQAELKSLADRLMTAPPVLVHRDMQSSNVHLDGQKLTIIDFQGMRLGPAAYDLASLLCDPYVMLPPALQNTLLNYYLERAASPDSTRETYRAAAVQRLAQALGAFGRLAVKPGTERFAGYIQPACTMMLRALAPMDALPLLTSTLRSATP